MAYALKTLRAVYKLEAGVDMLVYHVVLKVGHGICHVVTTNVNADEVYCRVSQAKDIGATTTRRLHLAKVDNNAVINQLLHKLSHRWHTYV